MPPARTSIWLHDANKTAPGKAGAVHCVLNAQCLRWYMQETIMNGSNSLPLRVLA